MVLMMSVTKEHMFFCTYPNSKMCTQLLPRCSTVPLKRKEQHSHIQRHQMKACLCQESLPLTLKEGDIHEKLRHCRWCKSFFCDSLKTALTRSCMINLKMSKTCQTCHFFLNKAELTASASKQVA